MSTKKPTGIPLAELLKPSPANNRNLDILLGNERTNQPGETNAHPEHQKLVRAIAREMRASRDTADARAAKFTGGRSKGADRDEAVKLRERIRALGQRFPDWTARRIFDCDGARSVREAVEYTTFANILSKEAPRRKKRPA